MKLAPIPKIKDYEKLHPKRDTGIIYYTIRVKKKIKIEDEKYFMLELYFADKNGKKRYRHPIFNFYIDDREKAFRILEIVDYESGRVSPKQYFDNKEPAGVTSVESYLPFDFPVFDCTIQDKFLLDTLPYGQVLLPDRYLQQL